MKITVRFYKIGDTYYSAEQRFRISPTHKKNDWVLSSNDKNVMGGSMANCKKQANGMATLEMRNHNDKNT